MWSLLEREWVSIRDPDDQHLRYTFDVSFLVSRYNCIYGAGCPGIDGEDPDPVIACCLHGAYYTEKAEQRRIERSVRKLGPSFIQNYHQAVAEGVSEQDEEGEWRTRTVNGGCIFLNRPDFRTGMGCAFHHYAMANGEHHMTHKPVVCWQVPIHRSIEEIVGNDGETLEVHTIAAYERGTWGDGGADFSWWCVEEPAAHTSKQPLYRSMEHELRAMIGDKVYDELSAHLDQRARSRTTVRFLPMVNGNGSA